MKRFELMYNNDAHLGTGTSLIIHIWYRSSALVESFFWKDAARYWWLVPDFGKTAFIQRAIFRMPSDCLIADPVFVRWELEYRILLSMTFHGAIVTAE
jgi:hypothetical protein